MLLNLLQRVHRIWTHWPFGTSHLLHATAISCGRCFPWPIRTHASRLRRRRRPQSGPLSFQIAREQPAHHVLDGGSFCVSLLSRSSRRLYRDLRRHLPWCLRCGLLGGFPPCVCWSFRLPRTGLLG